MKEFKRFFIGIVAALLCLATVAPIARAADSINSMTNDELAGLASATKDAGERNNALYALSHRQGDGILRVLWMISKDPSPDVQFAAANAAGGVNFSMQRSQDSSTADAALAAIPHIFDFFEANPNNPALFQLIPRCADANELIPRLTALVKKNDWQMNKSVAMVFRRLQPSTPELLDAMASIAHDPACADVMSCLTYRGKEGSIRLLKLINSPNPGVRSLACERLVWETEAEKTDDIQALQIAMDDSDTSVRTSACRALMAHAPLATLFVHFPPPNSPPLETLKNVLRPADHAKVFALLVPLFQSCDAEVRLASMQLLLTLSYSRRAALPTADLLPLLHDPAPAVAQLSASILIDNVLCLGEQDDLLAQELSHSGQSADYAYPPPLKAAGGSLWVTPPSPNQPSGTTPGPSFVEILRAVSLCRWFVIPLAIGAALRRCFKSV